MASKAAQKRRQSFCPAFPSITHSGRRWLCYKDTQVALKEAHVERN